MDDVTFAEGLARELELETRASRKCLEGISTDKFDWKPHETSLTFYYIALLVAEIPLWLHSIIKDPDIDFATYPHFEAKNGDELVKHFEENVEKAKTALANVKNGDLDANFSLKNNGQVVYSASKRENLETTINHMVHH
ncbi:MAG: DinB family protein, partial [Sphingobacteriaceae bacterium]